MARDRERESHLEWLGYLQPVGLVVSPPALVAAQAFIDHNVIERQQRMLMVVEEVDLPDRTGPVPAIRDFPAFTRAVLGWEEGDLQAPEGLEVALPGHGDHLRPTRAVRNPGDGEAGWLMLIEVVAIGADLDRVPPATGRGWEVSPQARFERLLRETRVPIGLLVNGTDLRLVYAPPGESSGHLTFPVQAMTEVAGRPILAALHMLLSAQRLFSLAPEQRLPQLLARSRRYQADVSTRLAEQVLSGLYDLLRGLQSADDRLGGELLRDVLRDAPDEVYAGLLTVLMRLVFLLYAEDRGLMPREATYQRFYSVGGLFDRLRADDGRYHDTMDHRFGAWAQLLTLFRLVYAGGGHGALRLPARRGYLFDPDRYPFLEGRPRGSAWQANGPLQPPLISDGTLFRVLQRLLIVDGERLSYRSLDVEQIGSVYERMMGFRLERARGWSIAVRPKKPHGAPVTIDLDALLAVEPGGRAKWLKEHAEQELTAKGAQALKQARTAAELAAALGTRVATALTPQPVRPGAMVLQPSEERRRSGSHYTPRSLTGPIVRKALAPVLARLGERPTPRQVLALKVADIAVGSGAFLVEACRQLAEVLVRAWHEHGEVPAIAPDEDEVLHARREVAQRCLYGVDKNPMAVSLAKLSLWLVTLARDHAFTFLDHALKAGDSLVGLTVNQIRKFHWAPAGKEQMITGQERLRERVETATHNRVQIIEWGDFASTREKEEKLRVADEALNLVRYAADLTLSAFFAEDSDRKRRQRREELLLAFTEWMRTGDPRLRPTGDEALRQGEHRVEPFHWQVEFPEVFQGTDGGFDCIVGNPPFLGGKRISTNFGDGYRDWLAALHPETNSSADLVAHFFRRAFTLLREGGTFGLIATNTIGQGDTRSTGLRWVCKHGGTIYSAQRRYKWPNVSAAVVVSVIHVLKANRGGPTPELDGKQVDRITAYLFHAGSHDDPERLAANAGKSFIGSYILGMGFTFDDTDTKGVASPLAEMGRLIEKDARNAERIFPYIGGEEVNDSPTHAHHRYAIDFFDMLLEEAEMWPDLIQIVRDRVKPERDGQKRDAIRERWWQYADKRPGLRAATKGLVRVLVNSQIGARLSFTFLPAGSIYSHALNVFALSSHAAFCALQCRVHEVWARFFGSSMKDDLRYTPTDCFETFPFPDGFEVHPALEEAGRAYYDHRAALMVARNEGLTKSYNRFHDPDERSADIEDLRRLHAAMDRAVLDAYGWADLRPACDFFEEHAGEEGDEDEGRKRRKRYRLRWPDEARDEVLARLLELNRQRAERERLLGGAKGRKRR